MRGYECYLYYKDKDGKLVQISNSACFSGLSSCSLKYENLPKELIEKYNINENSGIRLYFYGSNNSSPYSKYIHFSEISSEPKYIYIKDFEHEETSVFVKNIIKTINNITECSIVVIDNVKYIKYKLLSTYDQNLVLLNFIRNLWYSPVTFKYTEDFFKTLMKLRSKDRLERLTRANIASLKKNNIFHSTGHSNIHDSKFLKVKKTIQLLEYKGSSTAEFLKS